MDFFNLSKAQILKLNKDKQQKCILDIKDKIPLGSTIKNLILNSFKEMKDGFTPVTNQSVTGSVSNNLLKLEKGYYELQQYSGRNDVEILGLLDIFTENRLTEKVIELCNDVGVIVEVRDTEACQRLFQKESNNQLQKRTIARSINRRFAKDLLFKRNISSTLDFNKLEFPSCTQIYFNANLYGYNKRLWGV